jgi:anti-anti-sigma regulatory factor
VRAVHRPHADEEAAFVLRISTVTGAGAPVTLRVEGDLAGDWVPLLEAECLRHFDARGPVVLDLAGIGFIDRTGVAMLHGLLARGARLGAASPLVRTLLGRPGRP